MVRVSAAIYEGVIKVQVTYLELSPLMLRAGFFFVALDREYVSLGGRRTSFAYISAALPHPVHGM